MKFKKAILMIFLMLLVVISIGAVSAADDNEAMYIIVEPDYSDVDDYSGILFGVVDDNDQMVSADVEYYIYNDSGNIIYTDYFTSRMI